MATSMRQASACVPRIASRFLHEFVEHSTLHLSGPAGSPASQRLNITTIRSLSFRYEYSPAVAPSDWLILVSTFLRFEHFSIARGNLVD